MKSCITISLVEEARGGPFVLWDGLEKSIDFAAELGYDAVEIFAPGVEAIDAGRDSANCWTTPASNWPRFGHGGRLGQASLAIGRPRRRTNDSKPAILSAPSLTAAGHFGAAAIIGSMQGPSGHTDDAARGYLAEALEDGGAHAAQYNVPLIYEPLNRYETRQCCTVADGVELLESLVDRQCSAAVRFVPHEHRRDRYRRRFVDRRQMGRPHPLCRQQSPPGRQRPHAIRSDHRRPCERSIIKATCAPKPSPGPTPTRRPGKRCARTNTGRHRSIFRRTAFPGRRPTL